MTINYIVCIAIFGMITSSCQDIVNLDEDPLSEFSTQGALTSVEGFNNHMTALHQAARNEMALTDNNNHYYIMHMSTDVASAGNAGFNSNNYPNLLSPSTTAPGSVWNWAYGQMLLRANTIIVYADDPDLEHIWENEAEKNHYIAEAKFFRAYTHNLLANLYGGVPIVDTIYETPKTDFTRSTRTEVLEFARQDLEFASQWLPEIVGSAVEGRIVKAAADHLLTEVYISLEEYEEAVSSASNVINSGLYSLMTQRFGSKLDEPGDVFSDLFRDGNQNRSSGNMESIYVWQFEDVTPGGQGASNGNNRLRKWGPWYERLTDPDGNSGMVNADSLGRGTGQVRPTPYFLYEIWESDWDNDIRNSPHNIRRVFHYNNPGSAFYGQEVEPKTSEIDTMQNIYPYPRKIEGDVGALTHTDVGAQSGRTFQDFMVYRLAETYLLRAEAYYRMGNLSNAADDINTVRARANATLINPSDVTEDYILDERARELITEEPRRRTLVRMGRLVERVREHSIRELTRNSIQDHHQWWPIPQSAIDVNIGGGLEQTPGY